MSMNFEKMLMQSAAIVALCSCAYANPGESITQSAPMQNQSMQANDACDKLPAAYNAPARIDVQCSWDFFLSASFTYWQADQEAMDLAYPTAGGNVMTQEIEYKPGFKVAMGMDFDYDNWVGSVEYTWFRSATKSHYVGAYTGTNFLDHALTNFHSSWKANIDLVDVMMSRPYYQGKKLTILPFGGLRAAFIRQNLHMNDANPAFNSAYKSHSWAVGPRGGLQAHWLLGCGFRVEGDLSGSLLFTQYDVSNGTVHFDDYNTLRPMADMGVGLGWGSYLDKQNYHLDLLATYDFNVMFGQNMMRALAEIGNTGTSFEPAALHLQGLTLSARFDF